MQNITRPQTQIARPRKLERAFDDPDAVLDLIYRGAPYKTQEAVHKHPGVTRTSGWFRNFWALGGKEILPGAAPFFHNETFIRAAKDSFGADIVQPVAMMTNLNLPMAGLPPHLDLPFFRGMMNREVPAWMLVPMGYSGLFHDWAVPVASAITWFYDGDGGAFEYWPDGLNKPSVTARPPYFNTAILADNEYMYHRVGSLGRKQDWLANDAIPFSARLHSEEKRWVVRDGVAEIMSYPDADVRLSLLWKAYCFRSESEAAAFEDHRDDLTPEIVMEIFAQDLRRKGVSFELPKHGLADGSWKMTLETAYPAPSFQ